MKFMYFFSILNIKLGNISFIAFFNVAFYEIFVKLRAIFILTKAFTACFRDSVQPHPSSETMMILLSYYSGSNILLLALAYR